MARVIQVIETTETRGKGRDERDPIRGVRQYFTFEGDLLAENDPFDFGMCERSRLRETLHAIINLDHHNHGPESAATKLARDALTSDQRQSGAE